MINIVLPGPVARRVDVNRRPLSRTSTVAVRSASNTVEPYLKLQTPHSGYHFDGSERRFFEGWYFRVALPDVKQSFAIIYSIEDPRGKSSLSAVASQVMGPDDGYIMQHQRDVGSFWAARNELQLGCCFKPSATRRSGDIPLHSMAEDVFYDVVKEGFQASDTWHQGAIVHNDSQCDGKIARTADSCRWAFTVRPVYGYGRSGGSQQATAGWLSALQVFEPHWQVLMSHGLASGWLEWGNTRYDFVDAPAYAEKNWGGGFPSKWWWVQCNTFDGMPNLSVTCVGALRCLFNIPGVEEEVGMMGVHFQGRFIELVPWNGHVQWEVSPWGSWRCRCKSSSYEAVLEASADSRGTLLRAPTVDGLIPHCRDTFFAKCRLQVWELDAAGLRNTTPLIDATSDTAAAEVGGGPWWYDWEANADMKEPLRTIVQAPIDLDMVKGLAPEAITPPGL